MTTLEQILDLVRQARRSPHARRVLFDALIDRYGKDFLDRIAYAQRYADRYSVPLLLFVDVPALVWSDELWSRERDAFRWNGYRAWPAVVMVDRGDMPRPLKKRTFLTVIRPRTAGGL